MLFKFIECIYDHHVLNHSFDKNHLKSSSHPSSFKSAQTQHPSPLNQTKHKKRKKNHAFFYIVDMMKIKVLNKNEKFKQKKGKIYIMLNKYIRLMERRTQKMKRNKKNIII